MQGGNIGKKGKFQYISFCFLSLAVSDLQRGRGVVWLIGISSPTLVHFSCYGTKNTKHPSLVFASMCITMSCRDVHSSVTH